MEGGRVKEGDQPAGLPDICPSLTADSQLKMSSVPCCHSPQPLTPGRQLSSKFSQTKGRGGQMSGGVRTEGGSRIRDSGQVGE